MKHEMKLVQNQGKRLVYEGKNDKGQTVTLEIHKIEGSQKDKNFSGNMWAKYGFIKEPISSYWVVEEFVTDANGKDCFTNGDFNLTITNYKVNLEGMKEATQGQLDKIIAYANKALNEPIHTAKEKNFDKLDSLSKIKFDAYENRARKCVKKENPFLGSAFDKEASFISNCDIDGFYFKDYDTRIKCIAFKNGEPVPVYEPIE